jgi:hypothetical protein
VEEAVTRGETWGKRCTASRGVAERDESGNGGVRRRLDGDECWAAAYLSKGENNGEEEEALGVRAFYSWWRERECGGGPTRQ